MSPAPGQAAGRRTARPGQQGSGRAAAAVAAAAAAAAAGGAGAGRASQQHEQLLEPPQQHIEEARKALALCRTRLSSDKGLRQLQALAERRPGAATQLFLAKAELVRGVQAATQVRCGMAGWCIGGWVGALASHMCC